MGTVLVTPRQVIVSLIPVVESGRAPHDSATPGRPWLPQQLSSTIRRRNAVQTHVAAVYPVKVDYLNQMIAVFHFYIPFSVVE
jgi:hypothetical protein